MFREKVRTEFSSYSFPITFCVRDRFLPHHFQTCHEEHREKTEHTRQDGRPPAQARTPQRADTAVRGAMVFPCPSVDSVDSFPLLGEVWFPFSFLVSPSPCWRERRGGPFPSLLQGGVVFPSPSGRGGFPSHCGERCGLSVWFPFAFSGGGGALWFVFSLSDGGAVFPLTATTVPGCLGGLMTTIRICGSGVTAWRRTITMENPWEHM